MVGAGKTIPSLEIMCCKWRAQERGIRWLFSPGPRGAVSGPSEDGRGRHLSVSPFPEHCPQAPPMYTHIHCADFLLGFICQLDSRPPRKGKSCPCSGKGSWNCTEPRYQAVSLPLELVLQVSIHWMRSSEVPAVLTRWLCLQMKTTRRQAVRCSLYCLRELNKEKFCPALEILKA